MESRQVMVGEYASVRAVLVNDDQFGTGGATIDCGQPRRLLPLQADGEEHDVYRAPLARLLSAGAVERWEPAIRRITTELVEALLVSKRDPASLVDVNAGFSSPLPMQVFGWMMGIGDIDVARLLILHDQIMVPTPSTPPAVKRSAGAEVGRYFDRLVSECRQHPRGDVLGALVIEQAGRRSLTDEEISDICFLLLLASVDTVSQALSSMFFLFANYPRQRDLAMVGGKANPQFIEELLRWEPPAMILPRTSQERCTINGEEIEKNDLVLCDLRSANRDSSRFEAPERFDPMRSPRPHLAFGAGSHRCVGVHLARMELAIAVEEIDRAIEVIAGPDGEAPELGVLTPRRTAPNLLELRPRASLIDGSQAG